MQPWDLPAPELKSSGLLDLAGQDRSFLETWMKTHGHPVYRATQVFEGMHQHRWTNWNDFSNLSVPIRSFLKERASWSLPTIIRSLSSEDGATKHVFSLDDGLEIEGVYMPYERRKTLCISSQVGCAMGCTFCATGDMGIKRNLTTSEIVGQVHAMLIHHKVVTTHKPTDIPMNIVFMGMGEPLHNLDNVMRAFRIMIDPKGLNIPPKRITLSTSGLVPQIKQLGAFSPKPKLALSLNAGNDTYRSQIMPVNRVWGMEILKQTLREFPLGPREMITLEYVLLKGITDRMKDIEDLINFAEGLPCKINFIPFNIHEGSGYETPDASHISILCSKVAKSGIRVSVRRSRGQDVAGACGQLIRE